MVICLGSLNGVDELALIALTRHSYLPLSKFMGKTLVCMVVSAISITMESKFGQTTCNW